MLPAARCARVALWLVLLFQNLSLSQHLGAEKVEVSTGNSEKFPAAAPAGRVVQSDQRNSRHSQLRPDMAGLGFPLQTFRLMHSANIFTNCKCVHIWTKLLAKKIIIFLNVEIITCKSQYF